MSPLAKGERQLKQMHSYLLLRVAMNPLTIAIVACGFALNVAAGAREEGWSSDVLLAALISIAFLGGVIVIYWRYFRRRNSVRIIVSDQRLEYRDREMRIVAGRPEVMEITRTAGLPRRWHVRTAKGEFDFDGTLINAALLSRTLEDWVASNARRA